MSKSNLLKNKVVMLTVHQAINPTEVSMRIFGNGTVVYTMRRHLILNCEGDLPIFPFDSPMCDFNVESSKITIYNSDWVDCVTMTIYVYYYIFTFVYFY